jgi:hypothetical protein
MFVGDGDWVGQEIVGALITAAGAFGLRHAAKLRTAAHRMGVTPLSSTREAAPGKVRIRGRIDGTETVVSPFSKTPCYYYRVEIEESSDDGSQRGSGWTRFYTEVSPHSFSLQDDSGSVTVIPEDLEIEVPFTLDQEVITKPRNAQEQLLVDYVREHCVDRLNAFVHKTASAALLTPEILADPRVQEKLKQREARHKELLQKKTKNQSFRFRETCLRPGQQYEVVGTLLVNGAQRVVSKGRDENWPFVVSSLTGKLLDRKRMQQARSFTRWSAGALILGLLMCLSSYWH